MSTCVYVISMMITNSVSCLSESSALLNITRYNNLQSIYFRWIWLAPEFRFTNRFFVPRILEQVCSPSFEALSLRFLCVDIVDKWDDDFDWEGVADTLSQPQFANLKRVYVEWSISGRTQRSQVESFFANGPFSSIMKRGLVQMKFFCHVSSLLTVPIDPH